MDQFEEFERKRIQIFSYGEYPAFLCRGRPFFFRTQKIEEFQKGDPAGPHVYFVSRCLVDFRSPRFCIFWGEIFGSACSILKFFVFSIERKSSKVDELDFESLGVDQDVFQGEVAVDSFFGKPGERFDDLLSDDLFLLRR